MNEILYRFDFNGTSFSFATLGCLMIIWAIVLGCAFSSIVGNTTSANRRWGWIAAVAVLPIVGLAVYVAYSLVSLRNNGVFKAPPSGSPARDGL